MIAFGIVNSTFLISFLFPKGVVDDKDLLDPSFELAFPLIYSPRVWLRPRHRLTDFEGLPKKNQRGKIK